MVYHSILGSLDDGLRTEVLQKIREMQFAPGTILFSAGEHCQGLPLVVDGRVKVQMTDESGHSIVLYRIDADDVCTLSIGCLMTGRAYRAEAVVETSVTALMIPRKLFDRLMGESEGFRQSVMESYARRLDDLMLLVEEVAFRRMDKRLEEWLQTHAGSGSLKITHQQLAVELGTAREVVSRLLKELERRGRVRLSRGRIEVVNVA